ncbi:MAG: vWA domain-containing protein [Candidatus Limimorpha sp.]
MKKFCAKQMKQGDGRTIDVNLCMGAARFLMRLILILMLFPVSHGLKAQTPTPPTGLRMAKKWTPSSTNSGLGHVTLETFVTGTSVTGQTHAPTDIALVLDVSGSMRDTISRAMTFAQLYTEKGRSEGYYVCNKENASGFNLVRYNSSLNKWEERKHLGFVYGWAVISNPESRNYYITRMGSLQDAVGAFIDIIAADAIQHNVDHRISVVKFAMNRYYNNDESSVAEGNHTYTFSNDFRNYTEVFFNRRDVRTDAETVKAHVRDSLKTGGTTATDYGLRKVRYLFRQIPSGETDRAKVVVMFTDGSPTYSTGFQTSVADSAIANAKEYKDLGARVFAVGTFGRTPTPNEDTFMNHVSSNYPNATSMNNPGNIANPANFFFTAETPEQLSNVFETIAHNSLSIPFQMNAQTIVQDQIGADFELPAGTQPQHILVYNPRCTAVNTSTSPEYVFEPIGAGNQFNNAAVTITGNLIQVTGFNFSENWCGLENPGTPQQSIHGRKLVVEVPLKVKEGIWGDSLPTNGSNSVLYPDGGLTNPIPYPMPYANVLGDVWTEVVTEAPQGFDPQNIDSPEDLAWFISVVNGRANYSQNPGVSPTPNANGKLTADIDMSAHNWVSIGSSKVTYTGTFDGNGHVVTGLKNNASKFYKQGGNVVVYPGMFGKVGDGGVVKNVFVLESDFRAKKHDQLKIHYGILVDTLMTGACLFNCEAAGRLSTTPDPLAKALNSSLIFGGLVGLNDGGTVHSSMSMARLAGYTMGGAVGENKGNLKNSFTNAQFDYFESPGDEKYVGGLAGKTSGTVDNCYVRFERVNTKLNTAKFGQLAGNNSGTLANSHVPDGNGNPVVHTGGGTAASNYAPASAPYLYGYDKTTGEALLNALNANNGTGAEWKLTTAGKYSTGAGNINRDYPILKYSDYTCVASADGIALDYSGSLSDMLKRHNEGKLNVNTNLPNAGSGYVYPGQGPQNTHDYHVNEHPAIKGGTINLYANTDNSAGAVQSTAGAVVVYVDENISLLQGDNSTIEAYTCQTMTKPDEYWHTVSSSLNSDIGFGYNTGAQIPFSWSDNDPCGLGIDVNDDHSLFPHDVPVDKIDLFCFYEPQYHWINFKRNSNSHWHMDDITQNIAYTNETTLLPGKGYLAAIDKVTLLQNRGTLNNGDITIGIDYTANNAWTGLDGYNLIGNPYQSYLDFDQFANSNGALWTGGAKYRNTYAVYDPQTKAYIQYLAGSSPGSSTADRYINMHQGFFVVVDVAGTQAVFSNAMRTNTAGSGFRGGKPNHPLINLIVTDAKGLGDVSVLELGRGENTGARKMRLSTGSGRIYLRHEDGDYAILFRDEVKDYQPLYFEASEDGVYTLRWNTANAAFGKLTLVDNIGGVSMDMLATDSYVFTAKEGDYKSRFKIYVGSDAENPEVDPESPFAFMHNGQLVVNGGGRLDVVDPLGRILYSTELTGSQNSVSLPSNLKGVCILHLTAGETSKTQKVIL